MKIKEEFYKYGESLGIKINDLQRLKMLADNCQEDMADKRYTLDDMKKACACGIDIVCKEGPNDFQLFEDLINSLNKQD